MERELSVIRTRNQLPVEIDIRKILEQMGLAKERWPREWLENPGQTASPLKTITASGEGSSPMEKDCG